MKPVIYGPDLEDFPPGINPLTGLPVDDPTSLSLPAVLISVSNFPVSARPQAGLSFAPIVYEMFIGEGMTRFLTVFYGSFPGTNVLVTGGDEIRTEPFTVTGNVLGNRIWLDENTDGIQDVNELGLPGVRVDLHSYTSGDILDSITTDYNGFYGFNTQPGENYTLSVVKPEGFEFSPKDTGDNWVDSDFDPDSGQTLMITSIDGHDDSWDAGLYLQEGGIGDAPDALPADEEVITIGDRVWLDGNFNGLQDSHEVGVSDVLVSLYHWEAKQVIDSTLTDLNGYYAFQVATDQHYRIDFMPPPGLDFTLKDADSNTQDDLDSDVDLSGKSLTFKVNTGSANEIKWDAGLVFGWNGGGVGPVRSGRLPYGYVSDFFRGGCLVYAGKSEGVDIPSCASVFNKPPDSSDINNNYMNIERLESLAQGRATGDQVNYSGNMFTSTAPEGGEEASSVTMFYNINTQTFWRFDPLSGAFLRFTDKADGTGEFYPSMDKITGRQLKFENVIVLFAEHKVLNSAGTIIDIDINRTRLGRAVLFRDGKAYRIFWSTEAKEYEQTTLRNRPIKFVDAEGNPFPLKIGHTWVHLVDLSTNAYEKDPGQWFIRFYSPAIPE
jgi:hypothetical protein